MRLLRNHGNDRVIDELRASLVAMDSLDAVSLFLSLFAYGEFGEFRSIFYSTRLIVPLKQADVEPLALSLAACHQELEPAGETTVVFRDSAFAADMAKANLSAIFQQHGLEALRSL